MTIRSCVALMTGLLATNLFAAEAQKAERLVFRTTGNDTYADGTPVGAGECYAFVWQEDGYDFPGFPMNPPNPDDPFAMGEHIWVYDYYPKAERSESGGDIWAKCSEVIIAANSQVVWETQHGKWFVYLLDTRHKLADGTVACGFNTAETNAPVRINAYKPVTGLTDIVRELTYSPVGGKDLTGGATVADRRTDAITCQISFDAQGGTVEPPSLTLSFGDAYGTLPVPVREGCEFLGWFTSSMGGEPVTAGAIASSNATVYAQWGCTATFDANGGEASAVSRELLAGDEVGELPTAERKGYAFTGWFTERTDGDKIAADTKVMSNVTYYAQWSANAYDVDFDGRGGAGEMPSQPMTYDEEAALASNLFHRVGYTFLGWTDDEAELEEVLYEDGVVVSNLTDVADGTFDLYAVWQANEYEVAFNANGGTGRMDSQRFLYDETKPLSANVFACKGYGFGGWATSAEGEVAYKNGAIVSNLTAEADGTVELFAKWEEIRAKTFVVGAAVSVDVEQALGVSLAGYSAKGLPSGLTFKNGKISGTAKEATAPEGLTIAFTKAGSPDYSLTIVIAGLPTWTLGEFSGAVSCADGTHGTASFKVETSGKISNGKLLVQGTNWTFSAVSYDTVIDETDEATGEPVKTYVLVAEASAGKVKRWIRLDVTQQVSPDIAADAALAEGSFGTFDESGAWIPDEDCGFELWRNVWKDADAAAVLAGIGGKYTWLYSNEVDNVSAALTLDGKTAALKGSAKLASRANASVSFQTTALATTNGVEALFYVAPNAGKDYAEVFARVEVLPFAGAPEPGVAHRDPGVIATPAMDGDGALGTSKAAVNPAGGQVAKDKTVTLAATADSKNVFYRWEYSYLVGDKPVILSDEHDKLTLTMDGVHDVAATAWFRSKAACTNRPSVIVDKTASDAFARMQIGVYFRAQVSVPEEAKPVEFSAANLPTGLAIDKMTGVISGVPTANARGKIQITATSKANKAYANTITLDDVTAAALPTWAVGDFAGTVTCADGTHGEASFKVDAKGAVSSGKLLAYGTNWTFAAKSFDEESVTRGEALKFVVVAEAKSGKEARTVRLNVTSRPSPDVAANAALASGWFAGTTADLELWRNVWKDADAKAELAKIAGKYTYFFSNETQDVTLPLELNGTSGELKGSANLLSRGNKKVDFKTTAFATTNGVEATFYVAPEKVGQAMSGEICERFLLVPEAGEREAGRAHRAPGVLVSAKAYSDEDVGKCKAEVSPKGGQVDVDKDVTLSATPDKSCVFVRWEYERGGIVFTNENAKFSLKMDGVHDVTAEAVFRDKTMFETPVVAVPEGEAKKFAAMELGVYFSAKVSVTDEENMKPVKFEAKNLPSGLKIDATTGEISGVPTAAPKGAVTVVATSVANGSKSKTFTFETPLVPADLPLTAVGTFTGFIDNGVDRCGTVTLTASEVGKLSAKVIDAVGTYSFTGSGWTDSSNGVYSVTLKTSKGEELELALDANVPWNGDQLTGTFGRTAAVPGSWGVSAQRNAFGQPWAFDATGNEADGWTLTYTNLVKNAPLTVTLKLDGTTAVAGTLTGTNVVGKSLATYKISASGYANVSMMTNGAFAANFAPVVNKRTLSIRTNLWMDRSNDHTDEDGKQNVGFASFVD